MKCPRVPVWVRGGAIAWISKVLPLIRGYICQDQLYRKYICVKIKYTEVIEVCQPPCTCEGCFLRPAKIEISHEGIFPQKEDLVQFLSWEACSVVIRHQASIWEKSLHIGWTWWRCEMTADHFQESLGNLVIWCRSLLKLMPKPALLIFHTLFLIFKTPQALELFKGGLQVVFNDWTDGSTGVLASTGCFF